MRERARRAQRRPVIRLAAERDVVLDDRRAKALLARASGKLRADGARDDAGNRRIGSDPTLPRARSLRREKDSARHAKILHACTTSNAGHIPVEALERGNQLRTATTGSYVDAAPVRMKVTKDSLDLYTGLIRLHILHHAAHEEIFGLAIIEELGRHGYKLSAGTIYPILHRLERSGYLRAREQRHGKTVRRLYRATAKGKRSLAAAKEKVRELFGELFEEDD